MKEKARELEEQQKGMKKKINPKVINMIDRCIDSWLASISILMNPIFSVEKKEAALKKMLSTVLKDKEKIEATIEELDRYKARCFTEDVGESQWVRISLGYCETLKSLMLFQRFRRNFRGTSSWQFCEASAARWSRLNPRIGSESTAWFSLEAESNRT